MQASTTSGKDAPTLFHVTWELIETSEDGIRRSLVPIEESSAIAGEAVAYRDSVG